MSYTSAYASPNGPGDARPTALQIVSDAQMEGKLAGKFAVVTGSSSGFGTETVRALAATGLSFILPVRDLDKGRTTLAGVCSPDRIHLVPMDLTSLDSVRAGAAQILSITSEIALLVNNAGIMAVPDRQLTIDGFELQFATNHLAHFLLFHLLRPALLAGSSPNFHSRVVNVSSSSHRDAGGVGQTGDHSFENTAYHPYIAYARSKAANVYMANHVERLYGAHGLHATSVHPGLGATGLGRYASEEQLQALLANEALSRQWLSPEQGAATTVWAAIGREWEGRGGRYLAQCAEAPVGDAATASGQGDPAGRYACAHTYSPDQEERLWRESLAMVGLEASE